MADGALAGAAAGGLRPATDDAALARIRQRVSAELKPLADRIDRQGFYPEQTFRALGQDGAYAQHLAAHAPGGGPSLWRAIEAMGAIGAECMSTAFCAWCQDACGWYLEHSDNAALRDRLQPGIAAGALLGGTGLSNPMKALSGTEPFRLKAKRVAGGYILSGVLPWVSNLGPGHWFGTIAEDADDPTHRLMLLAQCGQEGVEILQNAHFVALEGTGTYSVGFRRAFIPDEQLLADPLGDMARRIRPGFVLLQTGMGFGVIDACIALMRQADLQQRGMNRHLPDRPDDIAERAAALAETVHALAATPNERAPGYLRAVLEARLAVSELTLAATQATTLHWGARGYLEGSPVHRRQREGVFVAIITPSIRHLRQELAAMARN